MIKVVSLDTRATVWINPERITAIFAGYCFGQPCTRIYLETQHPGVNTINIEGEPQAFVDRITGAAAYKDGAP